MNRRLILKTMLAKELRTMLRDRQQVMALVIGFASLLMVIVPLEMALDAEEKEKAKISATARATGAAATGEIKGARKPAGAPGATRWTLILIAAGMAWYASFFVLPLAIATFVGEKERGTLEVLLMTPLRDGALYMLKFSSVVIPGGGFGLIFVLATAAYGFFFHRDLMAEIPTGVLVSAFVLSLPFPFLLTAIHVGLGACCSVRASSIQSAGLLLGGVITGVMCVGGGLVALVMLTSLRGPTLDLIEWCIEQGFIVQYAVVVGLLLASVAVVFYIGRALFKREKLLL